MSTKSLSEANHIVRHCGSQVLIYEGERVVGVFPQAFQLRTGEKYLSACWLEFFPGAKEDRIKAAAKATATTRSVKPRHAFAVGNVGAIQDACGFFGQKVRILHEPKRNNPAYTAVRNFRSDEVELLELLATDAWSDLVEVRDLLS